MHGRGILLPSTSFGAEKHVHGNADSRILHARSPMLKTTLQDVHDPKTRDLMRGLLDRSIKPEDFDATLARLLSSVQKPDLPAFDNVLRKSQIFSHLDVLPEFPRAAPFNDSRGTSIVPIGRSAIDYIALRMLENDKALCQALDDIRVLNSGFLADDDKLVTDSLHKLIDNSGHSLTLARKAAFIIGYAPKDSEAHKTSVDLVSQYGINSNNYGVMVTTDAIGSTFNHLDLKYRFRNFATAARGAQVSRRVSHLCFHPLAATIAELTDLITASYDISLVDAAVALLAHIDHGLVDVAVSQTIRDAWSALATEPVEALPWLDRSDSSIDLWAFRCTPAFLEYRSFRRLRYALQPLYDLPDMRTTSIAARFFAADFFCEARRVDDLVPTTTSDIDATPARFDRATAGSLTRSCGLVWICDGTADFSNTSKEEMALLMGQTFEIDRLLSADTLRHAAGTATDKFVKLILQTLLRAHSASTRDNYDFKDQFQKYVRAHHGGDILKFMDAVRSLDARIVNYFVTLLDETLLSQMAFLMDSSEKIYDTRARLLEWYSTSAGDPGARDKAKQLRLDRKIAAVRGAINETRLNIDSVRFRQWIDQNKLSEFSDFIRQAVPNLPQISDLTDNSKRSTLFLTAHRDPNKRALVGLTDCYDTFCRNPDFGIASFLGRRIRHGTLRGTLLNGLHAASDPSIPASVLVQYQNWLKTYSASIDVLASRLYFKSRTATREGVISADFDTEQKWQVSLICLSQIFKDAQQDHGVLLMPHLIEQYCWLVFEIELAKVQTIIGEARLKWGTLKLRHSPSDHAAAGFERSINVTLDNHFATVTSWFRKPPNISPVAELSHIISVVIQEARDEYATFEPKVDINGAQGLELSGSTYYVVYDALTIAVRNAAKHGIHPGCIGIEAHVRDVGPAQVLDIEVVSDLKSHDRVENVLARIEDAGLAGASDADVVEGWSGIRKLKKMERDLRIVSFGCSAGTQSLNNLKVSISVPFKGLIK